jgi:hypothetical protein
MHSIRSYHQYTPKVGARVHIDPQACVIGRVTLGDDASVWPMAVLRGDVQEIRIGARTNVQDGSVLHVTHDGPFHPGGQALLVGDDVTVGHNATLHACTIGNRCLIGMGAIVLDGAVIEDDVILGAGSLVPPRKHLRRGTLWVGNPVREVRALTAKDLEQLIYSATHYVKIKDQLLVETSEKA